MLTISVQFRISDPLKGHLNDDVIMNIYVGMGLD